MYPDTDTSARTTATSASEQRLKVSAALGKAKNKFRSFAPKKGKNPKNAAKMKKLKELINSKKSK